MTKRENQGWHEKSLRHAVHGFTDLRNCRSMALVTGFWVEAFTHPALSNIENLELFSRIAVLSWGFFLGILFHFRTGRQLSFTCVFQLCFTWRHETSWDSSVFQTQPRLHCVSFQKEKSPSLVFFDKRLVICKQWKNLSLFVPMLLLGLLREESFYTQQWWLYCSWKIKDNLDKVGKTKLSSQVNFFWIEIQFRLLNKRTSFPDNFQVKFAKNV